MRTTLLAAVTALSLGVTAAHADTGQEPIPNTLFTEPPDVVAQAPGQNAPPIPGPQIGQQGQSYSQSTHGPWLFPPIGKYLDQQAGG